MEQRLAFLVSGLPLNLAELTESLVLALLTRAFWNPPDLSPEKEACRSVNIGEDRVPSPSRRFTSHARFWRL